MPESAATPADRRLTIRDAAIAASFASADVLVGVFVGLMLLSLGTHTH